MHQSPRGLEERQKLTVRTIFVHREYVSNEIELDLKQFVACIRDRCFCLNIRCWQVLSDYHWAINTA